MTKVEIKVDKIMFWRALEGKRIVYERIGSEFLGCEVSTVGELSPSQDMVNLSSKWFDLLAIKVKDIMK